MAKSFPHQISKRIGIYKWISFAILIFVIVEEMASSNVAKSTLLFIPGLMLLWKGCRKRDNNIKARFSDKKKYIRIQTQIYSKFIFWMMFIMPGIYFWVIQYTLDLRKPDLRKIVATTDFLVHKLFDLKKTFFQKVEK